MPIWGPMYISSLTRGANGVAEALCLTPHPPQAATRKQTLHRELHGNIDRKVDELTLTRESGKCLLHVAWYLKGIEKLSPI